MVRQRKKRTLDAISEPHVLRVVEVIANGVIVIEGSDAAKRVKQAKYVVHCLLPILDK